MLMMQQRIKASDTVDSNTDMAGHSRFASELRGLDAKIRDWENELESIDTVGRLGLEWKEGKVVMK